MPKAGRSLVRDCILAITASAVAIGVLTFLLACWFLGTWWPFGKGADLPWEALGRLAIPLTALFAAIFGAVIAGHGQSAKLRELKNSEDANVTERFTSALEQLANENENVQIGGIYALERIGHDSERERKTIVSILRSNLLRTDPITTGAKSGQLVRTKDVQAALTIAIIRLRHPGERDELESLLSDDMILEAADLSNTYAVEGSFDRMYLIQTSFRGGDYRRASFRSAILYRADFREANLERAYFRKADLEGAIFRKSDVRGARFVGAQLSGADFRLAMLDGRTSFREAELSKSIFEGVNLKYVVFTEAELHETDFRRATLCGSNFRDSDLKGARFQGANLRNAIFDGANLTGANFEKANIRGVKLTAQQISSLRKPLSAFQRRRIETVTVQSTTPTATGQTDIEPASEGVVTRL